VAVENARLYEAARRQQTLDSGQRRGHHPAACPGSAPAEVLTGVTRQARELSGADLAVLALPDEGGRRLTITYADGDGAAASAAGAFGRPIAVRRVLTTGERVISADFAADDRASQAARGAMTHNRARGAVPLGVPGNVRGVLTVGRRHGGTAFPQDQVDVAPPSPRRPVSPSNSRPAGPKPNGSRCTKDRDGSARDLHDLVIQRLYATGMSLEGTMPMITRRRVASRIPTRWTRWTTPSRTSAPPSSRCRPVTSPTGLTCAAKSSPGRGDDAMLVFAPSLRLGAGLAAPVRPELAEQMLAALREALSNAARHAQAHGST